jgi:hypothetical protein
MKASKERKSAEKKNIFWATKKCRRRRHLSETLQGWCYKTFYGGN